MSTHVAGLRGRLSAFYNTALPLILALLIAGPALKIGPLSSKLAEWQRPLSVSQTWRMYAPDPARAHTYLALYAEFADGRREALVEANAATHGWGSTWAGRKTRADIWRYYAVLRPNKANKHRTWYLRAVCVREALAREEPPIKIVAERVRRRFTSPDKIRAGKPGLGAVVRKPLTVMDCRTRPISAMIAAARGRKDV